MNDKNQAEELLEIKSGLLQVPENRQLNELVRGEFFVMNYLAAHNNEAHPKELSRNMAVSTARIAALLNHMEEKGLIVRTEDVRDNRYVNVSLTPEGLQAIQEKRGLALRAAARILEWLGPEDAQAYLRIQKKIITNSLQSE